MRTVPRLARLAGPTRLSRKLRVRSTVLGNAETALSVVSELAGVAPPATTTAATAADQTTFRHSCIRDIGQDFSLASMIARGLYVVHVVRRCEGCAVGTGET